MKDRKNDVIRRLVQGALLTALAVILSIWPKFPIFPAVSWMKFELSDIPVLLGGFALGPWIGAAIAVLKAVLNALLTGDANYIGLIMNIVSTAIPTVLAGLFYQQHKTRKRAYFALALFFAVQVLILIPLNYFIGSLNFNLILGIAETYADARAMILKLMGWICLFNLIKSAATVLVTGLVYKPLSKSVLSKELLADRAEMLSEKARIKSRRYACTLIAIGGALILVQALLWAIVQFPEAFAFAKAFSKIAAVMSARLAGTGSWVEKAFSVVVFDAFLIAGILCVAIGMLDLNILFRKKPDLDVNTLQE